MPTVAEVLRLDVVRRGHPQVVAASRGLERPVRWVHAIEFADAARLLRGGELVLATGIALPDEEPLLGAYVAGLAGVGVSALAVELGRKYTGGLPAAFIAAAEERGLPLIVFTREVPFIEITEAVHALIIEDQLDQLRASARLHEVFTDLAVAGAGPADILREAALLAGRPADPGGPVSSRAGLRAGRDRPGRPAGGLRVPLRRDPGLAPHRLPPRRRLAGHHRGRPRRGLGPGHPGLRPGTRPGGHRAGGTRGHHARAGPAAGPPAGKPGTAGAPHPDQHPAGPARRRSGRDRRAVPGPGRAGHRPAADHRRHPVTGRRGGPAGPGPRAGPGRGARGRLPRRADSRAGRLPG